MILSSLLSMAASRSSSAAFEPPPSCRGVDGAECEYDAADAGAGESVGRPTAGAGAPPRRAAASRFLRMISAKPPAPPLTLVLLLSRLPPVTPVSDRSQQTVGNNAPDGCG